MIIKHGRKSYETGDAEHNTARAGNWHFLLRFWLGRLIHDDFGNKYYIYKGKIYLG